MIRLGVLMWVWLIAGAAGVLFHVSYDVTSLEDDLSALNRDIVREQEAIRVLRAEWSYLNQPERLRNLAEELTSLVPIAPAQVIESATVLPMPLPTPDLVAADPANPVDMELVLARIVGAEDPSLQAIVLPPRTPERRPLAATATTPPAAPPATAVDTPEEPAQAPESTEVLDRGGLASLLTDLGIEAPTEGVAQ